MTSGRATSNSLPGRILLLNGAPRSGKSSLAKAVQAGIPGRWINLGVDAVISTLPPSLMPGIGLRPGGERPDLEPMVVSLYQVLFRSIVDHARAGFDIVADLGLHDDYSQPLGISDMAAEMLGPAGALIVGVDCGIAEIMRRRNADPRGGFYLGGQDVPAPVERWQTAVHEGKTYDLRLDMGVLTPGEGVAAIRALLSHVPLIPALSRTV